MTTLNETQNNRVLVIGATSSLAQAICRELAKAGRSLVLAGRDEVELELLSADLRTRFGTEAKTVIADLLNTPPERLLMQVGEYRDVIIATGDMGNGDSTDPVNIAYNMYINYTVPAQVATLAALHLSEGIGGSIVLLSSVAGDRGRQSNYAYGSSKAALTTFASGLRNRFYKQGVHVLTVKPGFTDTPMTWGMHSALMASRETVAKGIVRAMRRKKDVVYVPGFWALIMFVITHIPETVFKRLSL